MAILPVSSLLLNSKSLIPISFRSSHQRRFDPSLPFFHSSNPRLRSPAAAHLDGVHQMVSEFNPTIAISGAVTPPSSWYTDPAMLQLEYDRVFFREWHVAGFCDQVQNPNDFFTGRLGSLQFVICRDVDGNLHAFHNVCRHHASLIASGTGQKSCFVCPYHGWTYGLDGALLKATRLTGIDNFSVKDFSLLPLKVASWGPFILISSDKEKNVDEVEREWVGSAANIMTANGVDCSLKHVCRRDYIIDCNWKIFCDNYLDGGYHVPYAHGGLASGLKLDSYSTKIFEKVSIQKCDSSPAQRGSNFDRLGSKALYAFIYPNFMINRYGPWMDTNLVIPLGPGRCQVIFDYFLEPSLLGDEEFIATSLEASERVQIEDIELCEGVQKGLESPAYVSGRYAPSVEAAMHHFHCLLHSSLTDV